jgi:polysaccharide chain length determinant protein (PEP-CTERM system associated)
VTDTQAGSGGFDIQDVFEIALRRWRWIALGATGGLVLGLAVWWALPRRYETITSILVEPQGVPESYVRSTITLDMDQRIRTLEQRVTSHANLNQLIDRIGSERFDPSGERPREALMTEIRANFGASIDNSSRGGDRGAAVVELRYEGRDPEILADVVREIAELFIAENRKDRAQQAEATAEFLEKELTRVGLELTAQEQRLRDFRTEHLGALPSQLEANDRELDRLNESLRSNLEAQEKLAHQMILLRERGEGGSASSMVTALADARRDLIEARRIYTDDHPNVLSLQAQVEDLERELERESKEPGSESARRDPLRERELEAIALNADARRSEESQLRERISDLEKRVADAPRNEQALLELTRDYETLQQTYKLLLGNKHDAALSRNLEEARMAEQFKVLRPARTPTTPFWPDPLIVVPSGLAVGLGLALLLILWAEFRTPAFHSVDTLARRLGLPIFAAIPDLDRARIYDGIALPDQLDWRLVVQGAPNSAAAEQYRGFAPHFLEMESCRVILVTSAQPGDGKSVTCANLAWILASDLGRRVLLMDADLRRASQHRLLGVPRGPGLADVLRGEGDLSVCARPITSNLSLLPAGSSVPNPLALLTSEAFLKLCERASESYEVVMIDSPPILPVIDAKILRRMADMVVFVVRAGISPSAGVTRALRELREVAGLVFNRVSAGSFRRYYYYDAYSHYEYKDHDSAPRTEAGGLASKISRLLDRKNGSV